MSCIAAMCSTQDSLTGTALGDRWHEMGEVTAEKVAIACGVTGNAGESFRQGDHGRWDGVRDSEKAGRTVIQQNLLAEIKTISKRLLT